MRGRYATRQRARALALASVGVLLVASSVAADVRRLEAVGAVGVAQDETRDPRQRAIDAALREAVGQVASELLVDAPLDEGSDGTHDDEASEPDIATLLGDDMLRYALRFRVVDDRGIGPAMFVEDPAVTSEYVVVVEVEVESDRVRDRLVEAGLLRGDDDSAAQPALRLEVRGLRAYPAYEDLRRVLERASGGDPGTPLLFERGRTVLEVHTSHSGSELVEALVREAPAHLRVEPLGVRNGNATIAVEWSAPPEPARVRAEGPLPAVESPPRRRPRRGGPRPAGKGR